MTFSKAIKDFEIVNPGKLLAKEIKNSRYHLPEGCQGGVCIDAGCNMGDFELKHGNRFDMYVCIDVLQQNLDLLKKNLEGKGIEYVALKRACFDKDDKLMNVYAHRLHDGTYNYFGNSASVGVCLHENADSQWGWHKEDVLDEVLSISLNTLIGIYGDIKCLKVDIEAAEHSFLFGKDLSKIEYITGEFHFNYKNPSEELVQHISETHKIIKRRGHIYTFKRK